MAEKQKEAEGHKPEKHAGAAAEHGAAVQHGEKKAEKPAQQAASAPQAAPAPQVAPAPQAEEPKKSGKSLVNVTDATPGQVVKVFKKVGLYGECYQVLVRVLEGRDKGNLLRRNVRGPVKENDMLMLKETERDVRAV